MTRSPFGYPFARSFDADATGLAELQTDVMRFMAILALCLVAIFALVKSIPLAPVPESPPAEPNPEVMAEPDTSLVRPQPVSPQPVTPQAETTPPAEPRPAQRQGFTLRFEDEAALTRLVARDEVGLYAILPGVSYRMNVNRGQASFWPASLPTRFHEMDQSTVPLAVTDAFRQSSAPGGDGLKWGVTIPSATSRQIDEYLHAATGGEGGELIIDAAGRLRLEH